MTLDTVDLQILEILADDSRTPYADIARRLKLSRAVVTNRVNGLIARGVIRQFAVIVDPKTLGRDICVLFEIDTAPKHAEETAKILAEQDCTAQVYTTGTASVFCHAFFRGSKEFEDFVAQIVGRLEGVRGMKTNLLLGSYRGKSPAMSMELNDSERTTKKD
ncbi:MAG TPA: Lrp/AsnC family transcriptional regulator [Bacillota bacterium]